MVGFTVEECGDSALLVSFEGADPEDRWRRTHALARALQAGDHPAVVDVMPTYDTVLVEFDCSRAHPADVARRVRAAAASEAGSFGADPRCYTVPVLYGGEAGPDLEPLAAELGITAGEVAHLHANRRYTIRCIGSPAGAPMTDGPAFPAPARRLAVPRVHVPAGTVAVAGSQASVYATPSPGGWRLLGRTPLRLFDVGADPPFPYRAGDAIRFFAIDEDEWTRYEGRPIEADR